jgi:hypothetical protein
MPQLDLSLMALANLNPLCSPGERNKLATVRIIRGQPWSFDSKQDAVLRVAAMTDLGHRSANGSTCNAMLADGAYAAELLVNVRFVH